LAEPSTLAIGDFSDFLIEAFSLCHFTFEGIRAIAHALIEFV
jgi:hypothetical protein